jgi:dTDP-4-amino-4,6-dideoxygalactose transaminase
MIPIARPLISEREKQLVLEVLESGELAQGKKVAEFEEKFAGYIGKKYAVATSSGTTALHIALQACGIRFGEKVVTTPFSFIATANSILYCGAQPVFCDIDEKTFNISPDSLRRVLQKEQGMKALLIVHLFGMPCDMAEICMIAEEYGLVLIEDCAQAHGASYRKKRAGSFGTASIFSFYPTKNMTSSEGGIVLTDDEKVYREAQLLRNHGITAEYEHSVLGYNFRMTNISAAIALGQLERLDEFIRRRRENAAYLDAYLKDLPGIHTPFVPSQDYFHSYNQYTLNIEEERERFIKTLREKEIGYKVFYPVTIPDQLLYKKLGFDGSSCPSAQKAAREVVSIPVHPGLQERDLERIVESIKEYGKARYGRQEHLKGQKATH